MIVRHWLAVGSFFLVGCGQEEPTASAPSTEAPAEPPPTAPAPEPPAAPGLDTLGEPAEGRASAIVPEWHAERSWFEHTRRESPAKLGRSEQVTQILLGEEGTDGILITFYGRDLEPGDHRVLPATDETRRDNAFRDNDVFTVVLTHPGEDDLRSESGTVTIEEVDGRVRGELDVVVRSLRGVTTPLRARFDAVPNAQMDHALEQEALIRDQLRRKRL